MSYKNKITVIGLGYIGLPTAALLSSKGYYVSGIDINDHVVRTINEGKIHIVEPMLEEYVKSSVKNGYLKAFTEPKEGDIYMICVPTPFENNTIPPSPDISYVKTAVESIIHLIKDGDQIILESTSPVGTTDMIHDIFVKNSIETSKIHIAYCPERVLPGNIMEELVNNSRIIGGINEDSSDIISNFYSTFVSGEIIKTDARTAEMCKLTENSFRDVNIAFANELSLMCNKAKVNVWKLIELANHHPRVNILKPGPGVGGHCIAVDPWFLVSTDPDNTKIIKTSREVNDYKPKWVTNKIKQKAEEKNTKKIACLGLSFKPNIDDLRESPAIEIVNSLIEDGYRVGCVEPNIADHGSLDIIHIDDVIDKYDLIVILVNHKEFMSTKFIESIKTKEYLDFCGAIEQQKQT